MRHIKVFVASSKELEEERKKCIEICQLVFPLNCCKEIQGVSPKSGRKIG